jgi:hypothetical protein
MAVEIPADKTDASSIEHQRKSRNRLKVRRADGLMCRHNRPSTNALTARHSTQKSQNSQNNARFICVFREFCVDRRGWRSCNNAV